MIPRASFLLAFWLIPALGGAAEVPPMEELLPQKNVRADVMALGNSIRMQELDKKMQEAIASKREWWIEYIKANAEKRPLPHHENMGVTADEYAEYLQLGTKQTLEKVSEVQLLATKIPGGVQLRFDDMKNALQPIDFDFTAASVTTPLAKMTSPERRNSGPGGGLLGPHVAYSWSARTGTPESGTLTSVNVTIGRVLATGREFFQYKVLKVTEQKPEIQFETLLLYEAKE
jgi:hypothetical protein